MVSSLLENFKKLFKKDNKVTKRFKDIFKHINFINNSINVFKGYSYSSVHYTFKTRLGLRHIYMSLSNDNEINFDYKEEDRSLLFSLRIFPNGDISINYKKDFLKEGQMFDAILELESVLYEKEVQKSSEKALLNIMLRSYM